MPLELGLFELAATLFLGLISIACYVGGSRHFRWSLTTFACVALASILTPADMFSMMLLALAFLAVYFAGTRHLRPTAVRCL